MREDIAQWVRVGLAVALAVGCFTLGALMAQHDASGHLARMVPECVEDDTLLVGQGQFHGGRWDWYECGHDDN